MKADSLRKLEGSRPGHVMASVEVTTGVRDQGMHSQGMLRVIAVNMEFHQVLFRLCGNIFLANVIDEMAKKANLIRFASSIDLALLKQARDEHFQILDA